jgi:hypothetical protein
MRRGIWQDLILAYQAPNLTTQPTASNNMGDEITTQPP